MRWRVGSGCRATVALVMRRALLVVHAAVCKADPRERRSNRPVAPWADRPRASAADNRQLRWTGAHSAPVSFGRSAMRWLLLFMMMARGFAPANANCIGVAPDSQVEPTGGLSAHANPGKTGPSHRPACRSSAQRRRAGRGAAVCEPSRRRSGIQRPASRSCASEHRQTGIPIFAGRNATFAAAVEKQQAGPGYHFAVVGAFHLVGDDGVVARMRRDGWTLDPLPTAGE